MSILQIVQNNLYVFIALGVAIAFSFVFSRKQMRKLQDTSADFLKRHPEAAHVFLTHRGFVVSEVVTIYTVNGENPVHFHEEGKSGVLLLPGKNSVEVSWAHNRPGVLHKNVTTTTDVVEKILDVEPNKSYLLGFDRKEECFTFEEMTDGAASK